MVVSADDVICELNEMFGIEIVEDAKQRLQQIITEFNVSDVGLFSDEVVAFQNSNNAGDNILSVSALSMLEKHLRQSRKPTSSQAVVRTPRSVPIENSHSYAGANDVLSLYGATASVTKQSIFQSPSTPSSRPNASRFRPSGNGLTPKTSSTSAPIGCSPIVTPGATDYASRTNAGQAFALFGPKVSSWMNEETNPVAVAPYDSCAMCSFSYKFMHQQMLDTATILSDRIDILADCIKNSLSIDEDFVHIRQPLATHAYVTGMITTDPYTDRLTPQSVMLQGSICGSEGCAVGVQLAHLDEFSLFPGQVVVMHGVNSSGRQFIPDNILSGCLPPSEPWILDMDQLHFVIASGPFTTKNSLSYEPLDDLLKYIAEHRPHCVILTGPLLDRNQQMVKDLQTDYYEHLFEKITTNIDNFIEASGLSTQVVFVSSSRDASSDGEYPTPPPNLKKGDLAHVRFVPDPCLLRVGGLLIGVTSTDVLLQLSKSEISSGGADRMGRLINHLLLQQSFYPLYLPSEDLAWDALQWEKCCGLPVLPHLLILPSDLRQFVKIVSGVICVNAGRLARDIHGGTFCRLLFDSSNEKKMDTSLVSAEIIRV